MRKGPWAIAALVSTCCALLFAARFPVASEMLNASGMLIGSPASAKVIQVGDESASPFGDLANAPSTTTLDPHTVRGVLGSAVKSATNEDMGRVVDVIVDRGGEARAAVIDFGGFLGVGSRKIAVDWNAIRFSGADHVTLDMTRDQVKAAPEYQPGGKSIVVLGASPEFARSRMTERTPEQ